MGSVEVQRRSAGSGGVTVQQGVGAFPDDAVALAGLPFQAGAVEHLDLAAPVLSKLYFAYGFGNSLIYPLHTGSSVVLLSAAPAPGLVAEVVDRYRVSILHGVPSAYANLVSSADPAAFGTLRIAVSAGEKLGLQLSRRADRILGAPVLDELGSTEVGGAFCANSIDRNRPGTTGFPLTGFRLDLRDTSGQQVEPGTTGELWVKGPTLLAEYFRRPRETAEVLRDGWLRTGDLAVRNHDGSYVHQGRIDDMEMVGGITVSPQEVEETLRAHPAVGDIGVVAVPDERGATKLRAYFVPRVDPADTPDMAEIEAELIGLARQCLAPYKVPRSVTPVRALPRTPSGKLRRFMLREQPPAAYDVAPAKR